MNDTTERPPMTPEEEATGNAITASIDVLVDMCVDMGCAIAGDDETDDAAANALVIAEGVLARILSAYCRAKQSDEMPLEERDRQADDLLQVSAKHIRDIFAHFWAVIRAEPDPPADAPQP